MDPADRVDDAFTLKSAPTITTALPPHGLHCAGVSRLVSVAEPIRSSVIFEIG
jgi:hypothetical protein